MNNEQPRIVPELTTLCYLEREHQYLMLHRTVKEHDVNHDKWIGVGGHVESWESPEDCLLREVREETGLLLTSYRMRGIVTFLSGRGDYEYMFLYTADGWIRPLEEDDVNAHHPEATDASFHGNDAATTCIESENTGTPEASEGMEDPLPWCDEGVLEWVDIDRIEELNLWEGDKIFFRLIDQNAPFFSLKLVYDGKDHLKEAVLDGCKLDRSGDRQPL